MTATPYPPAPRKLRKKRGALVLLLLLIGLAATFGVSHYEARPVGLPAVVAERGDLEKTIRATGEVVNDRSVTLTALVDGQIAKAFVSRGDRVRKGDILASMDGRSTDARLSRAEALVKQQAILWREQDSRYKRLSRLARKGSVSDEDLEQAKFQKQAALAALRVAEAEAELTQVEKDWQQVRAPFDAIVVEKTTESGQWVEAGTQLFRLVATEGWEIEAHLDAIDSGRVALGQEVQLSSDSFPGVRWQAQVTWKGPMIEREQDRHLNTFPIRMGLGTDAPDLLLGQQLDVAVVLERRKNALSLPFLALRQTPEETFEVAVIDNGKVRFQAVKTGLETATRVEILDGLEEGQTVIGLDGGPVSAGTPAYYYDPYDFD